MTMIKMLTRAGKLALYIHLFVPVLAASAQTSVSPSDGTPKDNGKLQSFTVIDNFKLAAAIFRNASFRSDVNADTIPFKIVKRDVNNVTRYSISGRFFRTGEGISFSFGDSLVLNYRRWNVAPGNRISNSPYGISATGFLLTNDSASIAVANQAEQAGSPVAITIRNVDVSDIADLLSKDSLSLSGMLNAELQLNEIDKKLTAFTASASISQLQLLRRPIGNLQANARMKDDSTIHATMGLSGNDNDIAVNGDYFLHNKQRQLNALLDIKKLQVALLQGFVKKNVSHASGSIHGLIDLKGKFSDPEWNGTLNFDSVAFTHPRFGGRYAIDRQVMVFNYPVISLKNFTVNDSLDNALVINGELRSKTRKEYGLDLKLHSHGFSVVHAPKAINNQFFGYAAIDADITLSGAASNPIMAGDIYLNDKTNITLVLPEKNTDREAAISVVRFIDMDTFTLPERVAFKPAAEPKPDFATLLNKNLTIRADKQAALTIVIDPSTGDILKVKGYTKLNAGKDTAGKIVLGGEYLLDSGYYELNYQFLKKRFTIMPGSKIFFAGNPMEAGINISAEYIASTAAKDLLGNEVGSVDPAMDRSIKQDLPFRVVLFLTGSLKQPAIRFDIQLPGEQAINSKLATTIAHKLLQLRADVAATNRQVFALLVMGRFVGEQSTDFFKGNGGDFSDIAKESVSKFLSSALDQVASDLFKGVNVDLNKNSFKDFTNNEGTAKTDLNVEVSKNFLDDRLSVSQGENFGIESQDGSAKAAQQKGSRFLPDVTVNYKLSTDGRYMLRSYSKNQFEVILDGYITETGVAFIVTLDYDKFSQLLNRKTIKQHTQ